MSPRRRLRTRYEQQAKPAVAPEEPTGTPTGVPAGEPAVAPAAAQEEPTGTPTGMPAGEPAAATPTGTPTGVPAGEPAVAPEEPTGTPAGMQAGEPAVAPAPVAPAPLALAAPGLPPSPSRPATEGAQAPSFEPPAAATAAARTPGTPHGLWRRLRTLAALAGLALLAFATGLLLFNYLIMPRLIHGVGQIEVPDLRQLTVAQAEQALRPLGLQVSRAGERFDPSTPRGFVISQEPAAGSSVRGRKRVSVIVSLGEEYSSVPELTGESVRSARLLIERAGLQPGNVVQAPSEEVGEGTVAGSDPGPEAVLPRGTRVHLLLSSGVGTESFVMPELVGREIDGARRQLEALGFRVERTGGLRAVGTIVAQFPPAGSRITRSTVIQLTPAGRLIR